MTEFKPTDNRPPPVDGDELVTLEPVLLTLRATYFDPVLERDRPLPPHRWALWHPDSFSESATSDDDGVCRLPAPTMVEVDDDDKWALVLIPVLDPATKANDIALQGYCYIDVDAHQWLADDPVGPVHARRWLRFPAWTSYWKAREGGFLEGYPHDTEFAQQGLIRTRNLRRHGTMAKPWNIQTDHGWPRSYVAFHYHDHTTRALAHVPQGLALEVRDANDAVVGQSTCLIKDAIYVLQLRGKAHDAYDYRWRLDLVDSYSVSFGDREIVPHSHALQHRPTHRPLPRAWSSRSQYPWHGAPLPTPELRRPFHDLRTAPTTRRSPLRFHLDDVVLTKFSNPMPLTVEEQITMFDHRLAIKDPSPNPVQWSQPFSKLRVKQQPLFAEQVYGSIGDDLADITRVIEYDGQMFDLRDEHIRHAHPTDIPFTPPSDDDLDPSSGEAGADYLGLRTAEFVNTPFMVDTRYIADTYDGMTFEPVYWFVYVPYFVDIATHGASSIERDNCLRFLVIAARRWNNKYPGDPDTPSIKEIVAFPDPADGPFPDVAIRLRCHFGICRKGREQKTIFLHPGKGRANAKMNLFVESNDLWPAGSHEDDFDDNSVANFTLAHEIGHNMGFPDEYINYIDIPQWSDPSPRIATFTRNNGWRPFGRDLNAMMVRNRFQRLRYFWSLLDHAGATKYTGKVPRIVYAWSGGTLEYRPPLMPQHTFEEVWEPVATDTIAHARTALFATPADGGTLSALRGGESEDPINGVALVRVGMRFDFPSTMSDGAVWDCVADAWTTLFDSSTGLADQPFWWTCSSAEFFRRVLVEMQWHIDISRYMYPGRRTFKVPDVTVRVHQNGERPRIRGAVIDVDEDDVGAWLLRYAIGVPSGELSNRGWGLDDVKHLQSHIAHLCRESDGMMND